MGRLILGVPTRTPTSLVLNKLKWVLMSDRWKFHQCKMVFQAINNLAPPYICNLFCKMSNIHSHVTRNSRNNSVKLLSVKSEMGRASYVHTSSVIWNSLPNDVKNSQTILQFVNTFWRSVKINSRNAGP